MKLPEMQLTTIVSAPFEENTYVAHLDGREDCLIVDPGLEPEKILEHLDRHRLVPAAILNTHGHTDHIAGNAALKRRFPGCPLVIGWQDAQKLTDAARNLSADFGLPMVSPPADGIVRDGDTYSAAGFELSVREIPGHSAGHVVFIVANHQPTVVFVGDVIFAGGIGRTDFPDGDFATLADGIRKRIYDLPDDTVLLSGHGPPTRVGQEKRTNPFVRL